MNIKKIISLLLSFSMALTMATNVFAEKNVIMDIDENIVTRKIGPEMFGVNFEWSAQKIYSFYQYDEDNNVTTSPQVKDIWGDTLVFGRQAGASSQQFSWKKAIGPVKDRENQKMWGFQNDKVYVGPIEWLNALYTAKSDAEIIYTLNMISDSLEDVADLIEFLILILVQI